MEKLKWDGSVSSRTPACLLSGAGEPPLWLVAPGAEREHPRRGSRETVAGYEIGVAGRGWWVATAVAGSDGAVSGYRVDAALPVAPPAEGVLGFVDLDLDLVGDRERLALRDVEDFERRARTMGYPERVRRMAWAGLEDAEGRFTRGRWPFGGWLDARLEAALARAG